MKIKNTVFPLFMLFLATDICAQGKYSSIDSIVTHNADHNQFEGTVLVTDSSGIIYNRSFGFKDLGKTDPIDNNTHFSIASITKMFTSIIILQLIEEKKLRITDNLEKLLPTYKIPNSEHISVHHLLLHISGLPNENDSIFHQKVSPEQFINTTLLENPNELNTFNYTNIDYILLGKIIEGIDGRTWQESVQLRILDKLAMNDTGFLEYSRYPENYAQTFSIDQNNDRRKDPEWFYENYYAAGSMYSTASDLSKLHEGLYSEALLNSETAGLFQKPYPEFNYAGYGVWIYNYPFINSQPRIMERRGAILGSNSVFVRFLDKNKCIIILSNNNKFNPDSFGAINNLKEALINEVGKTSG
ncbi:serine hydrolase [Gramella sp. KN1008]|uniref:serine hydrolase domain-containing protein n=1 Tax=Gramella sp. KN1008 TaxID=2529298 RepID=UPI001040337F|nr:serine hydrolase domain-containing protein [Gramella sp. KN1008]TBW25893.1 class A beta-lactamase-related serine hydrolase [Gramella sp. KN1008]